MRVHERGAVRKVPASWVVRLRALTGGLHDDIRWNEAVSRWEFVLTGADMVPRSQFWGHFDKEVDPFTGLHPFRELDISGLYEALGNLEKTFIGNRHDGAGTTYKQIRANMKVNEDNSEKHYRNLGNEWADRIIDRSRRMRGSPQVTVTRDIA